MIRPWISLFASSATKKPWTEEEHLCEKPSVCEHMIGYVIRPWISPFASSFASWQKVKSEDIGCKCLRKRQYVNDDKILDGLLTSMQSVLHYHRKTNPPLQPEQVGPPCCRHTDVYRQHGGPNLEFESVSAHLFFLKDQEGEGGLLTVCSAYADHHPHLLPLWPRWTP